MKTYCKVMAVLMMFAMAAYALAQVPTEAPAVALANLTEGVGSITGSNSNWGNYSELVLIPGASLLGVKSATTTLTLGFTGGNTVDIGNMVLYKTARSGNTVLGIAKVKLGGVSNPSINLTSTAVCPVQPVSVANPCFVKLDPVKPAISPLNDYYFTVYFTNNSNNAVVGAAQSSDQGSLSGYFIVGDETRIKAKGVLPTGAGDAAPYFLTYVTNQ